ncbi:unnamed protein product [Moneuplotes crassus]|uniref:Uncharacterized protein n=1 Tax=Euplotes crassus TaxID=5936 RepID=A0AAD1UC39_EUPCR|nr:unnamed protein product [Moneuplotes crassus]
MSDSAPIDYNSTLMDIVNKNAIQPENNEQSLIESLQSVVEKQIKQLEGKNKLIEKAEQKFLQLGELAREERNKNLSLLQKQNLLETDLQRITAERDENIETLKQFKEINQDMTKAHETIRKLKNENKELVVTKYNLDLKKKELENANIELNVAESEKGRLKKELDDLDETCREAKRALEKLQLAHQQTEEEIKTLKIENNKLLDNKLDLENERDSLKHNLEVRDAELNQTKNELKSLKDSYNSLKEKHNDLKSDYSSLQGENESLLEKVKDLEESQKTLKATMDEKNKEISNSGDRFKQLQKSILDENRGLKEQTSIKERKSTVCNPLLVMTCISLRKSKLGMKKRLMTSIIVLQSILITTIKLNLLLRNIKGIKRCRTPVQIRACEPTKQICRRDACKRYTNEGTWTRSGCTSYDYKRDEESLLCLRF